MSFGKTVLTAALLIGSLAAANALGLGREGAGFGRLGLINNKAGAAVGPAIPCSGTGLIFTSACNSQYIGIL